MALVALVDTRSCSNSNRPFWDLSFIYARSRVAEGALLSGASLGRFTDVSPDDATGWRLLSTGGPSLLPQSRQAWHITLLPALTSTYKQGALRRSS